jgi:hypothetical protein
VIASYQVSFGTSLLAAGINVLFGAVAFNGITIPIAFKASSCRRAQLWNRQASIIMDLTTLALRQNFFGGSPDGDKTGRQPNDVDRLLGSRDSTSTVYAGEVSGFFETRWLSVGADGKRDLLSA